MSLTLAPDDIVRTRAEVAENAREPLLVLDPLLEFLSGNGLAAPPAIEASPIGEGHSNVTFSLSTGVVLRRPPRGRWPRAAAHRGIPHAPLAHRPHLLAPAGGGPARTSAAVPAKKSERSMRGGRGYRRHGGSRRRPDRAIPSRPCLGRPRW